MLTAERNAERNRIMDTPLSCACHACKLKREVPAGVRSYHPTMRLRRIPEHLLLAHAAYELARTMCESDADDMAVPAGHHDGGASVALLLRFSLREVEAHLKSCGQQGVKEWSTGWMHRIEAYGLANQCRKLAFRNAIELRGSK